MSIFKQNKASELIGKIDKNIFFAKPEDNSYIDMINKNKVDFESLSPSDKQRVMHHVDFRTMQVIRDKLPKKRR